MRLAEEHLPQAAGVLDIYHALEHLGDAVTAVWGHGSEASRSQIESGRQALVAAGKPGLDRWLARVLAEVPVSEVLASFEDEGALPLEVTELPDGRLRMIWVLRSYGGLNVKTSRDPNTSRRSVEAGSSWATPL